MRSILRFLKRIWFFSFLRRLYVAGKYYHFRYWQILKWGITSREHTNFTYELKPENLAYLASLIALVTKKDYTEILNYIKEGQNDTALKEQINKAREDSRLKKHADREIHFGRRLGWYAFARVMKPKVVVETGVDKGLGAVLMCAAVLKNKEEGHEGKYYGTDINPAAGYLLSGKYKEVGEILYGDSIESLSKMEEKIDLFINDSDHSATYEYDEYQTIKKLLNDDTIILGDNAHLTDKLFLFAREENLDFVFFKEEPHNHWYPGAGIGIAFNGHLINNKEKGV
ncbi:MAG TPA: class I SAM-dependent methyltransferase [Microscillaceae bacterium]|nr:class I SAM-dependent methyltransferase [Microscillaceae bacterium]